MAHSLLACSLGLAQCAFLYNLEPSVKGVRACLHKGSDACSGMDIRPVIIQEAAQRLASRPI